MADNSDITNTLNQFSSSINDLFRQSHDKDKQVNERFKEQNKLFESKINPVVNVLQDSLTRNNKNLLEKIKNTSKVQTSVISSYVDQLKVQVDAGNNNILKTITKGNDSILFGIATIRDSVKVYNEAILDHLDNKELNDSIDDLSDKLESINKNIGNDLYRLKNNIDFLTKENSLNREEYNNSFDININELSTKVDSLTEKMNDVIKTVESSVDETDKRFDSDWSKLEKRQTKLFNVTNRKLLKETSKVNENTDQEVNKIYLMFREWMENDKIYKKKEKPSAGKKDTPGFKMPIMNADWLSDLLKRLGELGLWAAAIKWLSDHMPPGAWENIGSTIAKNILSNIMTPKEEYKNTKEKARQKEAVKEKTRLEEEAAKEKTRLEKEAAEKKTRLEEDIKESRKQLKEEYAEKQKSLKEEYTEKQKRLNEEYSGDKEKLNRKTAELEKDYKQQREKIENEYKSDKQKLENEYKNEKAKIQEELKTERAKIQEELKTERAKMQEELRTGKGNVDTKASNSIKESSGVNANTGKNTSLASSATSSGGVTASGAGGAATVAEEAGSGKKGILKLIMKYFNPKTIWNEIVSICSKKLSQIANIVAKTPELLKKLNLPLNLTEIRKFLKGNIFVLVGLVFVHLMDAVLDETSFGPLIRQNCKLFGFNSAGDCILTVVDLLFNIFAFWPTVIINSLVGIYGFITDTSAENMKKIEEKVAMVEDFKKGGWKDPGTAAKVGLMAVNPATYMQMARAAIDTKSMNAASSNTLNNSYKEWMNTTNNRIASQEEVGIKELTLKEWEEIFKLSPSKAFERAQTMTGAYTSEQINALLTQMNGAKFQLQNEEQQLPNWLWSDTRRKDELGALVGSTSNKGFSEVYSNVHRIAKIMSKKQEELTSTEEEQKKQKYLKDTLESINAPAYENYYKTRVEENNKEEALKSKLEFLKSKLENIISPMMYSGVKNTPWVSDEASNNNIGPTNKAAFDETTDELIKKNNEKFYGILNKTIGRTIIELKETKEYLQKSKDQDDEIELKKDEEAIKQAEDNSKKLDSTMGLIAQNINATAAVGKTVVDVIRSEFKNFSDTLKSDDRFNSTTSSSIRR